MPYKYEYVPAEILVKRNNVTVFFTYKNHEYENSPSTYWYSIVEDEEDFEFDVRELPTFINKGYTEKMDDRSVHADVISEAITNGELDYLITKAIAEGYISLE